MCTDKPIVGQDQLTIDDEKAMKNEWMIWDPHLSTCKCTLGATSNPTAGWPPVPSDSGRLALFRSIETGRNWTEPSVNWRLGRKAIP